MEGPSYQERLLDDVRRCVRRRQLSPRTEKTYLAWISRFLRFMDPAVGEVPTVGDACRFVEHLTSRREVSAATQNLAASALAFLFTEVLRTGDPTRIPRARGRQARPTVLSGKETKQILLQLSGWKRLAGCLMYGSGLRLTECMQLRVKDISLEPRRITVRDGKGRKDRDTFLPAFVVPALRRQVARVKERHGGDLRRGGGWARLPGALHLKWPRAGYEIGWQFMFPSGSLSPDPKTGRMGRFRVHPSAMQRSVKAAVTRAGIPKRASCHTFRHSFATHALRMGLDIQTVKELMGHKDVKTTMIYAHVLDRPGYGIESPLDRLMRD